MRRLRKTKEEGQATSEENVTRRRKIRKMITKIKKKSRDKKKQKGNLKKGYRYRFNGQNIVHINNQIFEIKNVVS